MRCFRSSALLGSFVACNWFHASAQDIRTEHFAMPDPPPPAESAEAMHSEFRFDPMKRRDANERVREAILRKLNSWRQKLSETDKRTGTSVGTPPSLEVLAPIFRQGGSGAPRMDVSAIKMIEDNVRAWQ